MSESQTTARAEAAKGPFQPEAFGKYYLVDRIAAGGMAEIFKAKKYSHGGYEQLQVIKRILPHISANQDFVDMFIDEAKITVALQHPNIVRIYDFGKISDNFFIEMEHVDGKDVRNLLRKLAHKKSYLPPRFCAYIAHETCKGLHYAHTKSDLQGNPYGIVHRDISPSNVLVSYDGEIKVADFGIAKAESNAYQTRDGMLKGKFDYMSPEQADGHEIDHRSDVFSAGIMLYEMMTGRRLFKTDSEIATLKKIRSVDFEKPSKLKPDLPPALEAICLKALSKYPEDRYQTAQEMGDELRELLFPATSDTLRSELKEFMHQLFVDDMADERRRLEAGSLVARQLRDRLPQDQWDGQTDSTMNPITQTTVQYVVPWLAGLGLAMLAMFGVALVAVVWLLASQSGTTTDVAVEQIDSDLASIDIMVMPEARILVDGELKGTSTTLTLEDLEPGTYLVRLEADNHVPAEETVQVESGQVVKVMKQLEAVPVLPDRPVVEPEPVEPEPKPDPQPVGPPRVDFRSTPSGATVMVDGNVVGTTPTTWRDVETGESYRVEMRLEGHETATGTISRAREGYQRFSLTLPEITAPARLTVAMVGGGWAHVYVDGEKLKKTAPFKDLEVTPGKHDIRVENPALGLDLTETHSFSGGSTVTIRAKGN